MTVGAAAIAVALEVVEVTADCWVPVAFFGSDEECDATVAAATPAPVANAAFLVFRVDSARLCDAFSSRPVAIADFVVAGALICAGLLPVELKFEADPVCRGAAEAAVTDFEPELSVPPNDP